MRRTLILGGLGLMALVGVLWLTGQLQGLAEEIQVAQRAAQDRLAGAIRALRGGEPGALAAFWGLCGAYGVLHAAGPGHGKLIIGAYGVGRRVPVGRLAALALASSLAQAAVAVALVYALLAVLGLGRGAVEGAAERWVTPIGHAMIAGLGLWLVWRGLRGLRAGASPGEDADGQHHDTPADHYHGQGRDHEHGHGHEHKHGHGPHCNHAHGPTLDQVANVTGWRDGLALVAGIAMRPCTGALFVLVLTWQLGIAVAGVIGAFVMGLGTALVTVTIALLSVSLREGALSGLGGGRLALALPVLELAMGAVVAFAALGLLIATF